MSTCSGVFFLVTVISFVQLFPSLSITKCRHSHGRPRTHNIIPVSVLTDLCARLFFPHRDLSLRSRFSPYITFFAVPMDEWSVFFISCWKVLRHFEIFAAYIWKKGTYSHTTRAKYLCVFYYRNIHLQATDIHVFMQLNFPV